MNESSTMTDEKKENTANSFTMMMGNTTFIIGIHFSETSKETLDDKVKRLIRQDIDNGNF